MPSIPHSLTPGLLAYAGPLLALAVALAGALLCRGKGRRELLPAVGALSVLIGWATSLPRAVLLQAASAPRGGPELLLLPAVAAIGLALLALWWFRARAVAVILVAVTGWWVAGSPGGRGEFWRVWAGTAAVGAVLGSGISREPFRGLAAAVALWGGLTVTGPAQGWTAASLVATAAWAGLLPAGTGAFVPAGLMAGLVVAADLAAGRLVRGGLNGADVACMVACGAPFLAGAIAPRTKRLGAVGPALAGLGAGLLMAGVAWVAHRAMRS